jgi:hypothetical protein
MPGIVREGFQKHHKKQNAMKKILLASLVALGLTACDKSEQVPSNVQRLSFNPISVADLPARITNHVATSYPNATVLAAAQNPSFGYEVWINTGWELYYNTNGEFVFKTDGDDDDVPVAIGSLPAGIAQYVAANYPSATILWAEWDDDEFEVYLDNGIELYFDRNGNFRGADRDDVPVDPANLPASIRDYITQNYPGASIVRAERDESKYEVYLDNGFELYFDLNGNFIGFEVDERPIPIANLPQAILDYVATNYPNQTIVAAEIDDNYYEVTLNNGTELYFDLNGNFLFADFD